MEVPSLELLQPALEFLQSVLASVVAYYICKWLENRPKGNTAQYRESRWREKMRQKKE